MATFHQIYKTKIMKTRNPMDMSESRGMQWFQEWAPRPWITYITSLSFYSNDGDNSSAAVIRSKGDNVCERPNNSVCYVASIL